MENKTKYRAYFFQNFYLQGIHAGIQSQHTTAEMFVKYAKPNTIFFNEEDGFTREVLFDWATNHKTTIVLNGGMQTQLQEVIGLLGNNNNTLPWAYFAESTEALNGCITNVGVVVPEYIYNNEVAKQHKNYFEYLMFCGNNLIPSDIVGFTQLTEFEFNLYKAIKSCRLM